MDSELKAFFETPIGFIELTEVNGLITGLYFRDGNLKSMIPPSLKEAVNQINAWFAGAITNFTLSVNPAGTPFQKTVWNLLTGIPFGETVTYGDIARKLGLKNGSRAVGMANGANPVSIIIPCHRVIGADGKLTGYGGGLWRKEWLLKFEKSNQIGGLFGQLD
ncbi:MAG: methylated-DNA--[protein]-cysteine S-methyltransferase [Lentimicrobium sp.]|nr:methylated-DNA--[protein]-cysteine S-methyltransferase [Lentimicrobium sp.]